MFVHIRPARCSVCSEVIKINTNTDMYTTAETPHHEWNQTVCTNDSFINTYDGIFYESGRKNLNLNSRVHEWVHTRSLHWFFLLRIHNMHKLCHSWCRRYNLKLESVNVLYARIVGKRGGGGGRNPLPPENYFFEVKVIVKYPKVGLEPLPYLENKIIPRIPPSGNIFRIRFLFHVANRFDLNGFYHFYCHHLFIK